MAAGPSRRVQVWTSPVLVLPGGIVQLQPHVAAFVARTLVAYARAEDVDLSDFGRHVVESCSHAAALASSGHPDVRNSDDSAESSPWPKDEAAWMTASDAAEELELSREHVCRLARSGDLGPTRLVKKKRLVLRAEVLARAKDKGAAA